jgi:hypothetical protein
MSKHFQLTIADSCDENWDKMTPVEKGRFCDACQKQVIDFTGMSDAQVAAFFKKPSTGSLCGRFMKDQLDREVEIPGKRIPWVKYFFQFAIPAFLLSYRASAQVKQTQALQGFVAIEQGPSVKGKLSVSTIKTSVGRMIGGRVVDTDGNGISDVSVMVAGDTTGVSTDSMGYFRLLYKGLSDRIDILANYGLVLKQKKIKFKKHFLINKNVEFVFEREKAGELMMGAVSIKR